MGMYVGNVNKKKKKILRKILKYLSREFSSLIHKTITKNEFNTVVFYCNVKEYFNKIDGIELLMELKNY